VDELIEEKIKVVLNLIRTNNTADDALKITQAVDNLARARNTLSTELKTTKKQGSSAT
jgi:hypothetical protein